MEIKSQDTLVEVRVDDAMLLVRLHEEAPRAQVAGRVAGGVVAYVDGKAEEGMQGLAKRRYEVEVDNINRPAGGPPAGAPPRGAMEQPQRRATQMEVDIGSDDSGDDKKAAAAQLVLQATSKAQLQPKERPNQRDDLDAPRRRARGRRGQ